MIRYLLDTDTCVELIRGRNRRVLRRLRQCRIGEVGISCITLAELQYGVCKSADPERNHIALAEFCAPLEILPFDDDAANSYGRVRRALEKVGTPIGPLDTLIAAHGLSVDAVVVTNNEREFRRVDGLSIENWT